MNSLSDESENRVMRFRHDVLTVQCILPKKSWASIQDIDRIVAESLALTPSEADYIANYDVKYRIGSSDA